MILSLKPQPRLGKILLQVRKDRKLAIGAAAAKAGISKGLLSGIEHGRDLHVGTLEKILHAYGLKLSVK